MGGGDDADAGGELVCWCGRVGGDEFAVSEGSVECCFKEESEVILGRWFDEEEAVYENHVNQPWSTSK